MFLNSDTIKKRAIRFDEANDYFEDDGRTIRFEDILSFYHQEIMQVTNSVYEGTKLVFTLYLKNDTKPYIVEIDSNKEDKYKTIYTISNAIARYRAKKILANLQNGQGEVFETLRDFNLSFENGVLELCYTKNRFAVQKVKLQKNLLVLECEDGSKETLYANSISDIGIFLQIVSTKDFFSDETDTIKKRDDKAYFVLMALMAFFGINGFFDICCMQNDVLEGVSRLSQVMLGVFIMTAPVFWLSSKSNYKKMKKEMDSLMQKEN
ncbi:MAG: hypothetical protein PHX44_04165 [Sulfurimonas sp.]|uniref:hypothetical protein n=1 Tax=Sulfurimonas sp. TaxID=2022749 RepID=UPI0026183B29|nr:hypothetical protein [Sulfurimonas sp.]MDD2652227.1 hypothetical protein [Sulfurimonas sp.]MDD3450491.1 hypothetical protein [Sulfurimonas sp.]